MPLCSCPTYQRLMQCAGGREANLVHVNDKLFHRLESHVVLFFVPGAHASQQQTTAPNKRKLRGGLQHTGPAD